MPLPDARGRANARHAKANVKQVVIKYYPAETDFYEWTKAQENVQGYVKALIRSDSYFKGR